ncbi:MAG: hypothetical protein K940chlam2_00413 [Chlamydiae bacterium]|nr:hypothetical protein [Chlamydiota bacterium]
MHADFDAKELSDPSLKDLRERIKKAMIPLLIRVFELKLAANQAARPPSRLQKKSQQGPEEIRAVLKGLQEDLHHLSVWTVSAQKQIEKALNESEEKPLEEPKERVYSTTPTEEGKKIPSIARLKKWIRK